MTLVMLAICMVYGQDPVVFKTSDFDLQGKVKSCLVITDYGQEAFEFNKDGFLTKVTTRYSETDYDVSYYKYYRGELKEKRLENYREDKLDKQTSIANIYEIDTVLNKIVKERIYSYQNEFLDQYEYSYDDAGRLIGVTRSNNDGIDETQIVYDSLNGEKTKEVIVNGIMSKIYRSSEKKVKKQLRYGDLEKEYLNGEPYKATEIFRDSLGRKLNETKFTYDTTKSSFVKVSEDQFQYGEKGFLSVKTTKQNEQLSTQEYIYQFDAHKPSNWIKQIITPENEYITRRITYYDVEDSKPE